MSGPTKRGVGDLTAHRPPEHFPINPSPNLAMSDGMAEAMQFMFNADSKRKRVHIWTGTDTACGMWSAGTMSRDRNWGVFTCPTGRSIGRPICNQCMKAVEILREWTLALTFSDPCPLTGS